jgi:hypothetical protein
MADSHSMPVYKKHKYTVICKTQFFCRMYNRICVIRQKFVSYDTKLVHRANAPSTNRNQALVTYEGGYLHVATKLCSATSCTRRHADRIASNLVARQNFIVRVNRPLCSFGCPQTYRCRTRRPWGAGWEALSSGTLPFATASSSPSTPPENGENKKAQTNWKMCACKKLKCF